MTKVFFVSVVRDFDMYNRCVVHNPNCAGGSFHAVDNRSKNEFISVCYNRFLNQYDFSEDAWIVFCHEDFQLYEPLEPFLEKADRNTLYGPIGVTTKCRLGIYYQWKLAGVIETSNKFGENVGTVGRSVPFGTPVETFDCQCLIVHSSLIRRTGTRFDEHLSYDLYVEDFCMQAKENHNVLSAVLPVKCRHWSYGNAMSRYHDQARYLEGKWPNVCYTGTSSHIIGGGASLRRRFDHSWKSAIQNMLVAFRGLRKRDG